MEFNTLNKPTRITYESHGIKTQVSHPNSQLTADEFAAALYTVIVGSGFNAAQVVDCLSQIACDDN
jgi:hypothetical protein